MPLKPPVLVFRQIGGAWAPVTPSSDVTPNERTPASLGMQKLVMPHSSTGCGVSTAPGTSPVRIATDHAGAIVAAVDPGSATPLYWARQGDQIAFSPDARSMMRHLGLRPEIDWAVLAQSLRFPDLRGASTAVRKVAEVMPGTRARFAGQDVEQQMCWPALTCKRIETSFEASATRLRTAISAAIAPLSATSGRLLLQLSGGLDSSIVAAALAQAGVPFDAVTLISDDPDSDERRYARTVARHLGLTLHERSIDVYRQPIGVPLAPHLPRPTRRLFAGLTDKVIDELAHEHGYAAVVTGGGGDNVFAALAPGVPTAGLLRRGRATRAVTVALAEALVHRTTVWSIAASAARVAVTPWHWLADDRFLARDMLALRSPVHPWRCAVRNMGLERRAHVDGLVIMQNYLDAFAEDSVARHHPLLARAVMEACLSAPMEAWVAGGRDRSLARTAYRDLLPREILQRRGKGSFQSPSHRFFEANRVAARELLLGGVLGAERVIDVEQLSRWFASGEPAADTRMLSLVEAETWARHWSA